MSGTPEIRSANLLDHEAVWVLLGIFATTYSPDRGRFDAAFPLVINGGVFLVAERDGLVIGYLLAHVLPTLFAGGPILEVIELIVDPGHRGKGYGRALVEAAIVKATDESCVEVVVPTRRAQAFYESMSFEATATYLKRRLR